MKIFNRIVILAALYLIINKPEWVKEVALPYLRQLKDAMNEKTAA